MAERRRQWAREAPQWNPEKLVFVDECGAQTTLTPLYGRAPVGQRVVEGVPADHWHTRTLVGALRLKGPDSPMVLEGALDGASFLAWAEQVLLPTLSEGDLVILDNLAAHALAELEPIVGRAKASVKALPPYSPDLSPIERMWGKIKEYLRRAKARTAGALLRAIKRALATVTAEDAAAWFAFCGYRNTVS